MSKRDVAMEMIEARFVALEAGDTSATVHAELGMAVEMAHSLGAITLEDHRGFVARHQQIITDQHKALMAKMERYA